MHPTIEALVAQLATGAFLLPDERAAVALSGGADSGALLLALVEAARAGHCPMPLAALHFHHGMRGSDADEDAAFCASLAARLGIPCLIGLGALRPGASEAVARDARYGFLIEAAREVGATAIATGHTADDVAETVLLRVLRGTSPDGLAGIPARRQLDEGVFVVRPLLFARRAETLALCAHFGVAPRHDPTNDEVRFPRNRLRRALPALHESFNPRLTEALTRLAALAEGDRAFMEGEAQALHERAKSKAGLDAAALLAAPIALRRRVLLRALREASPRSVSEQADFRRVEVLEALLLGGPPCDLPGGVRATLEKGVLRLARRVAPERPWEPRPLVVPGETPYPGGTLAARWVAPDEPRAMEGARIAELPEELFRVGLCVRPVRPGERLAPLGMRGRHRLAFDLLAEAGVPADRRPVHPALARADTDELLWLIGVRHAHALRRDTKIEARHLRICQRAE